MNPKNDSWISKKITLVIKSVNIKCTSVWEAKVAIGKIISLKVSIYAQ